MSTIRHTAIVITSDVGEQLEQAASAASGTLPMGTKVFAVTQTTEDLERLRMVYEAAPLLSGKPS